MATIRSVFSPGTTFNVLDPNAWVGGVVPGPNDIAQIGENGDYRATINTDRAPYSSYASPFSGSTIVKNSGSVIFPWEGNDVIIPVNSNAYNFNSEYQWPDTNGSFLVYPQNNFPDLRTPIKIDYVSKSIDTYTFQSCSVDRTFNNWIYKTGSDLYDGNLDEKGYLKETTGLIRYSDYVYPLHTKFELTGSDTWHVGQIETLERCHFTIKDNATLKLDGTTVNPNAIYNNSDSYNNEIRILNNATVELTGSVQRTNAGIFLYNRDNSFNLLQISGSDLCPNTTLSQSAQAGDSTIILTNTASIGEGSIISIDNKQEQFYYKGQILDPNFTNPYANGAVQLNYPTGSYIRPLFVRRGGGSIFISSSFKEHEVVQVVSQSGHEYTVAKLFGKEGQIQQDLGLFTYEQFVQNFSGSLAIPYEGQKRAVLIDSLHKDFQPGEKLIINRSKVVDVLYQDYYLSESLFLDFENGATADSIYTSSYSGYTGSFIDVTTNSSWNLYYENFFRNSQNWVVRPRTGSDAITITSSLHTSDEGRATHYGGINNNSYAYFILPNTYFHEGEVSVEYDRNYLLSGSSDINGRLALILGLGHKLNGRLPAYNGHWSDSHYFASRNEDRIAYLGFRNDGGGYNQIAFRSESGVFPDATDEWGRDSTNGSKQGRFKLKNTIKKGTGKSYINDILVTENENVQVEREPIRFHTYRNNINIFNIRVKEYYQLVLLDTEESFNYKDKILEGVGLEYNQEAGKRVRTNGNRIKDPLGYKNLTRDLSENGKEATILPYAHSQTTSVAQNGNYNSFYQWQTTSVNSGELRDNYLRAYTYHAQYQKTGTGYYIIYDLQTEVSMSSLAFTDYYDHNYDYTTRASHPVQIDVSNDIENWTTVYGPANDPRYTTRAGEMRFYDFTSGSISARFVKLYLNGSSRTTNNLIDYLGLYNFYDENNQDMGNTIELYNADMFEVGDKVFFQETRQPRALGRFNDNNSKPGVEWDALPGVTSGTTTDDDVCGGLTYIFTITAKNGNRITLDRKIAHYPIYKDTFIYKWNQGSINFKGNYNNLAVYYQYVFRYPSNNYQVINANFDHAKAYSGLAGRGDTNHFNGQTENVSLNLIDFDSGGGFGGNIIKNTLITGGGSGQGNLGQVSQYTPESYDALVFNNVLTGFTRYEDYFGFFYANYINNYVFTYNRRSGGRISYIILNTADKTVAVNPNIKFAHNYFESNNRNVIEYAASGQYTNFETNIDNVVIKDNYSQYFYVYGIENPAAYPTITPGLYQYNPNIEDIKFYGKYTNFMNYHKNSLMFYGTPYYGNSHWFPTFVKKSVINNQPLIIPSFNRGNVPYVVKNPSPNIYSVYKVYPQAGYNTNQSQYGLPFIYHAKIKLYTDQEIKIYCSFDYNRPSYFEFGGNFYDNNNVRRGYFSPEFYYPRTVLVEDKISKIIAKEELSETGDSTLIYNKTHTLPKGEYTFALQLEDSIGSMVKAFEHGPIDFNIFATNPSQVKVYYSNWDSYKMFEGQPIAPLERFTDTRVGKFKTLRASNTLPTGTIKIRTLKL